MKVGVIGAGTMGSGIAQAFAQTEGYEVYLCDINDEFAANGKKKIAKGFEKRVARGKMDQAKADAMECPRINAQRTGAMKRTKLNGSFFVITVATTMRIRINAMIKVAFINKSFRLL